MTAPSIDESLADVVALLRAAAETAHYQVLGVPPHADTATIRNGHLALRQRLRLLGTQDLGPFQARVEAAVRAVDASVDVLLHPLQRLQYDTERRKRAAAQAGQAGQIQRAPTPAPGTLSRAERAQEAFGTVAPAGARRITGTYTAAEAPTRTTGMHAAVTPEATARADELATLRAAVSTLTSAIELCLSLLVEGNARHAAQGRTVARALADVRASLAATETPRSRVG